MILWTPGSWDKHGAKRCGDVKLLQDDRQWDHRCGADNLFQLFLQEKLDFGDLRCVRLGVAQTWISSLLYRLIYHETTLCSSWYHQMTCFFARLGLHVHLGLSDFRWFHIDASREAF